MAPPPPPPPPMLFGGPSNSHTTKSNNFTPAPDRNALLSQIRSGAHLKKSRSNDRSAPQLNNNVNKPSSGDSPNMARCRTNGPTPMIPPGGLFPHGMPKLRSTAPRIGDGISFHGDSSIAALNRTDVGSSHSHPPSPASKVRQTTGLHRSLTENAGNRNFPSDLNLKGPAPAPPPSNLKPNLMDTSGQNRYPTVRRSVSQTSLGPKVRPARPPPNVKPPPPPPKSTSALQPSAVPPALPSKPPNVKRRQSFGVSDSQLAVSVESMKLSTKSLVPPPPPRNSSVPNSLHQIPNTSPTTVHVSRMTTAPPPPPPNRPPGCGVARTQSIRPLAPRTRPPDPPSHSSHPAPPSQTKAMPLSHFSAPPPPPARVSSITNMTVTDSASDFESRFFHKFRSVQSLPLPERFMNLQKSYPSKIIRQKSMRRLPPPPPPTNSVPAGRQHIGHQPMLHIQLESRVFVNNTAHC